MPPKQPAIARVDSKHKMEIDEEDSMPQELTLTEEIEEEASAGFDTVPTRGRGKVPVAKRSKSSKHPEKKRIPAQKMKKLSAHVYHKAS